VRGTKTILHLHEGIAMSDSSSYSFFSPPVFSFFGLTLAPSPWAIQEGALLAHL
jgi:hypothetical protein